LSLANGTVLETDLGEIETTEDQFLGAILDSAVAPEARTA
jgi:hypothetical protein